MNMEYQDFFCETSQNAKNTTKAEYIWINVLNKFYVDSKLGIINCAQFIQIKAIYLCFNIDSRYNSSLSQQLFSFIMYS